AHALGQLHGIDDDVFFGAQIGVNIDSGIGDVQRFRVGRHIQKKHMADAALGADATGFIQYGTEQFIGGNAAFHQGGDFAAADHGDGGFRRLVAVFGVADFNAADIHTGSAGT